MYCQRNAKACPVIEVTDPGDPEPRYAAKGAELRTDLPRYSVYRNGVKEGDVYEIRNLWTSDSVAFLLGSSLSFDEALDSIPSDKTAVFWACGVTPQRAAIECETPLLISHAPGHGFITDISSDQFCLP